MTSVIMKNKRCQILSLTSAGPTAPPIYFNGEVVIPGPPTVEIEEITVEVLCGED